MKESFYTRTSDGQDLYTVVWRSDQPHIKGSIQLCHGMAEHIGRYEDFAFKCNQNGYHVFGHDCRGHGKTAELSGTFGDYGQGVDFNRLAEDVIEIKECCMASGPVYLIGHSMGSFISRRVIQLYSSSYKGVILSGSNGPMGIISIPANLIASVMNTYQPTAKAKLLNHLSFGSYNQSFPDSKTPFDWLSSDERAVQQYIDDPMCGFVTTNRFYKILFNGIGMIYNKKAISDIRKDLPMLFISGEDDPVGDFGKGIFKSAQMYQTAGIQSVEVQLYENGRHEMLNEHNSDQVIEEMLKWIKKIEG
ncbi:alpha/beta hydrolase [Jeotgalibacillus haloalkalitolerans]|uniref:Alpha/beta hydrolase n=1 Tax=Jeotgalibacillus haloalkalitolerans TaxID=3104292 RepID=A0ABU5KL00_9BACL|nr:alpha/beta hydrolase [Jeotgalibacillus sp. HH7-29]MDZ5711809.1 alpha/beta hydrolase [Jeotgalibacillus sp. HH7-29]